MHDKQIVQDEYAVIWSDRNLPETVCFKASGQLELIAQVHVQSKLYWYISFILRWFKWKYRVLIGGHKCISFRPQYCPTEYLVLIIVKTRVANPWLNFRSLYLVKPYCLTDIILVPSDGVKTECGRINWNKAIFSLISKSYYPLLKYFSCIHWNKLTCPRWRCLQEHFWSRLQIKHVFPHTLIFYVMMLICTSLQHSTVDGFTVTSYVLSVVLVGAFLCCFRKVTTAIFVPFFLYECRI